jgi:hypothetical protein
MGRFLLVVGQKHFVSGSHQVSLGHHPVRIVAIHSSASLAILPVKRLFESEKVFRGQLRKRSLNFGYRAHG